MSSKGQYLILAVALWVLVGALGAAPGRCAATDQLSTVGCDRQETSFGDLTADALCDASGTVISLAPAVGFKSGSIPAAGVTRDQIASLLQTPDETWAVCRLTGDQIRKALERSLNRLPLPSMAFLQVSGLTVNYDASQPRGERVTALTSSRGPVQAELAYEVAMPLSLAQGGSGYFQVFDKDSIIRRGTAGLADAVYGFRQANPERAYTGQGRIVAGG
jgi:5'-nucleotidase / UDP-sugar diphosphatase